MSWSTKDIDMPKSGQQTAFSTGAVRDSAEGKPRMDLLPWGLILS